ncbi:hypothetical protein C882_1648 [Caenispirillum salinarum AK4]|uniref:Uncharacterized protein n=1 Tax=Caenispirillum salinarum AK4 TaxID=1238182 RepID=K9H3G1_9PROT|nr:hypothetical protein C882_1648 [Caenispirillum salinarum AK4]
MRQKRAQDASCAAIAKARKGCFDRSIKPVAVDRCSKPEEPNGVRRAPPTGRPVRFFGASARFGLPRTGVFAAALPGPTR